MIFQQNNSFGKSGLFRTHLQVGASGCACGVMTHRPGRPGRQCSRPQHHSWQGPGRTAYELVPWLSCNVCEKETWEKWQQAIKVKKVPIIANHEIYCSKVDKVVMSVYIYIYTHGFISFGYDLLWFPSDLGREKALDQGTCLATIDGGSEEFQAMVTAASQGTTMKLSWEGVAASDSAVLKSCKDQKHSRPAAEDQTISSLLSLDWKEVVVGIFHGI